MVVIVLKLKKIKITRAFFFFFWKNKNWLKNCFYLRYFNHFFIIIFCHLQRVWCSLQEQVASSFWNKTLINYMINIYSSREIQLKRKKDLVQFAFHLPSMTNFFFLTFGLSNTSTRTTSMLFPSCLCDGNWKQQMSK